MHASTDFVLRGGDAEFANRQKLLFDQLSIAEGLCNKQEALATDGDNVEMHAEADRCNRSQSTDSRDNLKRKRETSRFRGKESIFKRPEGPAPRTNLRSIPDYHRNPHKWTKYSLSDVSNEDMTDDSNRQAAMSFFKELKTRRRREDASEREEKMDAEPCKSYASVSGTEPVFRSKKRKPKSQIVFKKPQNTTECSEAVPLVDTDERPVFRSSKIILPEYVVGQKPKRTCKQNQPAVKIDRSKELRLDHLREPDEEEKEDEN